MAFLDGHPQTLANIAFAVPKPRVCYSFIFATSKRMLVFVVKTENKKKKKILAEINECEVKSEIHTDFCQPLQQDHWTTHSASFYDIEPVFAREPL